MVPEERRERPTAALTRALRPRSLCLRPRVLSSTTTRVNFRDVGYPQQLRVLLGIAKLAGAMVLLLPRLPTLKESAYAGFTLMWIAAVVAHYLAASRPYVRGVDGKPKPNPLCPESLQDGRQIAQPHRRACV